MEEEEEGAILAVSELPEDPLLRPRLGLSDFDQHYRSYRCCYCDEIIALNPETTDLLVAEKVAEWRHVHPSLPHREEDRIREHIEAREAGFRLVYKQYIHYRCLHIVKAPENEALWAKIVARRKINMAIPDSLHYHLYYLDYRNYYQCAYCEENIDACERPGFAYMARGSETRQCSFMHFACRDFLVAKRTPVTPQRAYDEEPGAVVSPPPGITLSQLWQKNLEWYDYLGRELLKPRALEHFLAWATFLDNQRRTWSGADQETWKTFESKYDVVAMLSRDRQLTEEKAAHYRRDLEQRYNKYNETLDAERLFQVTVSLNVLDAAKGL